MTAGWEEQLLLWLPEACRTPCNALILVAPELSFQATNIGLAIRKAFWSVPSVPAFDEGWPLGSLVLQGQG